MFLAVDTIAAKTWQSLLDLLTATEKMVPWSISTSEKSRGFFRTSGYLTKVTLALARCDTSTSLD